jgi:hypothetical protein
MCTQILESKIEEKLVFTYQVCSIYRMVLKYIKFSAFCIWCPTGHFIKIPWLNHSFFFSKNCTSFFVILLSLYYYIISILCYYYYHLLLYCHIIKSVYYNSNYIISVLCINLDLSHILYNDLWMK